MDFKTKMIQTKIGLKLGKEKSCNGKLKYFKYKGAEKEAQKLSKRFNELKHVYYCIWCNCYHIGRQMSLDEQRTYLDEYN